MDRVINVCGICNSTQGVTVFVMHEEEYEGSMQGFNSWEPFTERHIQFIRRQDSRWAETLTDLCSVSRCLWEVKGSGSTCRFFARNHVSNSSRHVRHATGPIHFSAKWKHHLSECQKPIQVWVRSASLTRITTACDENENAMCCGLANSSGCFYLGVCEPSQKNTSSSVSKGEKISGSVTHH